MAKNILKATVARREDLTDELFKLWLWLDPEDRFSFKPGQYCTIELEGISRPYSIASAPHEDTIELFVRRVAPPDGQLTPLLHKLEVWDSVLVRPRAKGLFTLQRDKAKNHVFVSTATGVVPYISMLRDYRYQHRSGDKFFMLHGASYQDELAYDEELMAMTNAYLLDLTCVFTVSRPDDARNSNWDGETGRVNNLLVHYLYYWGLTPDDTIVYVCGNPGMIEDVKERLSPENWQIVEERFWKE